MESEESRANLLLEPKVNARIENRLKQQAAMPNYDGVFGILSEERHVFGMCSWLPARTSPVKN